MSIGFGGIFYYIYNKEPPTIVYAISKALILLTCQQQLCRFLAFLSKQPLVEPFESSGIHGANPQLTSSLRSGVATDASLMGTGHSRHCSLL